MHLLNVSYTNRHGNCQKCLGSTHAGKGRKEGNVLFNEALNTFYLRVYGIRHMVKGGWKKAEVQKKDKNFDVC